MNSDNFIGGAGKGKILRNDFQEVLFNYYNKNKHKPEANDWENKHSTFWKLLKEYIIDNKIVDGTQIKYPKL